MPLIENCSWDDCKHGRHHDMGDNAILIQIADPATFFPQPKAKFAETYMFEFLDAEDTDVARWGGDEFFITDYQANKLVCILQNALTDDMNVLVHCHAGICRSGAVVEVATMMGFVAVDRFRQPNLRVKHKMMRALGLTYDSDEEAADRWQALYDKLESEGKM